VNRRDTAKLMAALALLASFTPTLMRRRGKDQVLVSLAAAGMGAAAGTATEYAVVHLARRLDSEDEARAVLVAAGAIATAAELPKSPSSAVALLGTTARVSAVAALVGAIAPVRAARRPVLDAAGLGLAAAAGGLGYYAWRKSRPRKPRLRHYPAASWSPHVSGGEGSLVPRDTLDFEGTRFLAEPEGDAIRVFVGVKSAPTVEARCDLAVAELERLGAFEKARIVVWSATLRGYVNPVPVAAEEALSDGDVASVVVQYYDKRTALMPLKVPIAARTHRELLKRLQARSPQAEIAVYGESLGAWASQNVFRREGVRALDALGVSRALWVGTPFFSRLKRDLRKGKVPTDARVAFVESSDVGESPDARFVFFERRNDPVVIFSGLELAWRRPAWLPEDIRRHWQPGITFVQLLADLFNATNWTAAVPQAFAHDYRVEVPLAVNLAFGHDAPRAEVDALAETLLEREIARGRRLREFKHQMGTPGVQ
jgi:uncharacterized membrane protein